MKLAASLLACAVFLAGAIDATAAKKDKDKEKAKEPAAAAKPALVGSYGDWKVYHSASGKAKICYLLAEPKARDPDDSKREKAYAFISERPAEHVRNEVSFVMGFEVAAGPDAKEKDKKDAKAKDHKGKKHEAEVVQPTVVIGDNEYDLAPKGTDLWVKDQSEEGKVIEQMKKGSDLVINASAKRGGATKDTYSLAGFSQAIDKAVKDCASAE